MFYYDVNVPVHGPNSFMSLCEDPALFHIALKNLEVPTSLGGSFFCINGTLRDQFYAIVGQQLELSLF